jgi:hypothetical protein
MQHEKLLFLATPTSQEIVMVAHALFLFPHPNLSALQGPKRCLKTQFAVVLVGQGVIYRAQRRWHFAQQLTSVRLEEF